MKRAIFTTIAMLLFFTAFTQNTEPETTSFRIDYFKADSLYLVEVRTKVVTDGTRPEMKEIPVLLTDTAQVTAILNQIDSRAEKAQNEANDLSKVSAEIKTIYGKLKAKLNE